MADGKWNVRREGYRATGVRQPRFRPQKIAQDALGVPEGNASPIQAISGQREGFVKVLLKLQGTAADYNEVLARLAGCTP